MNTFYSLQHPDFDIFLQFYNMLLLGFHYFYLLFFNKLFIHLFNIQAAVFPPSSSPSSSPNSPMFPPQIQSSTTCVQKRADFPQVSTKHGVSSCTKTKHLSMYYGWVRRPIKISRVLKAGKIVGNSNSSNTREDQATHLNIYAESL